ncbi:TRAP transporter large permease [Neobacillus niacini]|uniref:TRAP transporter large permease n=1 Tax=Neobacillus niacini TaxID=86668 RepID=UPI0021CB3DEA|nr:TRAP transporter large permease [Neobacillus niacini]MCM3766306.1 TRAP transporter large permease [Neobacillus niacini]
MMILILFVVLLFSGIPIAFVIGITAFLHLLSIDGTTLIGVTSQRMLSSVNNFTLLAIPFFVLAGELMNAGGITARLLDLSRNLVGHLRGGLAYVNVLIGLFLGAIVGSANAEAAIRSSTIVPEMEKDGFDRKFAAALTTTSSVLGPIHPPSMTFIIYGVVASTSIGALFMAGILPAFFIAAIHFIIVYFYARKRNFKVRKFPPVKQIFLSFLRALPALSIPIVILGGIYSGAFTPTEAGAVACFVAILVGMFYYKTLKLSDFPKIFLRTGLITSTVTFIIATANILGWSLALEQIPQQMANYLLTLSDNPYIILFIINILLLIIGMFMEVTAALLILVPVFLPVILALGIDPVHFGVIICLNLTIGLVTPPVGVVLYIVSNMTKVKLGELVKASFPLLIGLIVALFIISYMPGISLWIPHMLGY